MNARTGPPAISASKAVGIAVRTVEWLAFWATIVLPLAYLPVLYGLNGTTKLGTLASLLVVNVGCLLLSQRSLS